MAFDPELTDRLRRALGTIAGVTEKRMMGGQCFFLNGNMVGGADRSKEGKPRFMFRTGKDNDAATALPGGQVMIHGGRVMSGMYFLDADRCDDALLGRWLEVALSHARKLPAK